ncbi:MAG: hypothetical protein P1U89_17960 [Verrucomicrobiales bacterium]|nr:hypothetical protein [Verrucomicrobiales bacterium]
MPSTKFISYQLNARNTFLFSLACTILQERLPALTSASKSTFFYMKCSLLIYSFLLCLFLSSAASAESSKLETLAIQAPNASDWASAPLDQFVPSEIRTNLIYLREDLLDEGAKSPKASKEAYMLGRQLCDGLISAFRERSRTLAEAGYRRTQAKADSQVTGGLLDTRRNYMMSWPQYAREQVYRTEIIRQQENKIELKSEKPKLQWVHRAEFIRKRFDVAYSKYRSAIRKSGVVVKEPPVRNVQPPQTHSILHSAPLSMKRTNKGGRLRVWGKGWEGQDASELLGNSIFRDIVRVCGNNFSFMALDSKGIIHVIDESAWGHGEQAVDINIPSVFINNEGQVILRSHDYRSKFNRIDKPVVSVKGGDRRFVALAEDGSVHLLIHDKIETERHQRLARELAEMDDVVAIDLAYARGIALRRNGTVFTWADRSPPGGHQREIIEAPRSVRNIVSVQAGITNLALDNDGKVHVWSNLAENEPGLNLPQDLGKVIRIRASNMFRFYAAQLENGQWKAWGGNEGGVVDFVNNKMGPALDLDFSYWHSRDTGIVWWIEPED